MGCPSVCAHWTRNDFRHTARQLPDFEPCTAGEGARRHTARRSLPHRLGGTFEDAPVGFAHADLLGDDSPVDEVMCANRIEFGLLMCRQAVGDDHHWDALSPGAAQDVLGRFVHAVVAT